MAMQELNPFHRRAPSPDQALKIREKMEEVTEMFAAVYDTLLLLPLSRERAIALTKLEESAMWANKCVAIRTPSQSTKGGS